MSDERVTWFRWPGSRWHCVKIAWQINETRSVWEAYCGQGRADNAVLKHYDSLPITSARCQRCEAALRKLREETIH